MSRWVFRGEKTALNGSFAIFGVHVIVRNLTGKYMCNLKSK